MLHIQLNNLFELKIFLINTVHFYLKTLYDTKRSLDLRNLELIDANSELDAKENEIQNLLKQMVFIYFLKFINLY